MQHLTIKAASTATDQGLFSAIAASWSLDREGDQIARGAFASTIRDWQASGKRLPVHWNHSGDAADVIGWVDPASMREADEGLYVKGRLDLEDSEVAREAWRSMKNNAVSLSFGFMVTKSRDRSDGVRELLGIDLFEISIVPIPANADTRFLSLKSAGPEEEPEAIPPGDLWLPDETPSPAVTEEMVEEIEELATKSAKRNRPVHVKRFEVG